MFKFFEGLINPYPEDAVTTPSKKFFTFVWQATKGTRLYIAAMMFCAMLFGIFEAYLYAMLGKVVDWLGNIEPSKLWQEEGSTLLILMVIVLGSILVVALRSILQHQTLAGNFPMRLRWNFHRLMLGQSMNFFQDEFAGRISAKVMQTAIAVRDTCFIVTEVLAYVVVYFTTMMFVVGGFDTWLLLPFFIWMVFYAFALWYFVPRLSEVAKKQADARSLMTGRITDSYTNISTIKLFSHTGREAGYAGYAMQEFMKKVHAQMRLVTGIEIVNHILSMLLILGTTGVGLLLWTNGTIGIGAVAASATMALRLNGLSHWIMWETTQLFENVGTVQDGINTLTTHTSVVDKEDATDLEVPKGEIRFENVNFYYDRQQKQSVIDNMNLVIKPGEKIGLVGRSGAGKSTLVNLLLRFYDIKSGSILIDGTDISTVTQQSLRAQIGMVTQDTSLLHRSIRDNLMYGNPDATEEDMIAAAHGAEMDTFIETLQDSKGRMAYDVHVGERGVKLSGGQRQRIAIARVMLKNAPVLLLDEATSALDSEVENVIQRSLYRLMEGKTVIAIAHRLSTIAAMDRLIVLDKGKIVEEGDHNSLLAQNGLYAKLWKHQSGGFLTDDIDE